MENKTSTILLTLLILTLTSCYRAPEIEGFDADKWKQSLDNCDNYRLEASKLLLDQWEILKGETQNEIRELLGKETQHSLYLRNQKFFFYDLNCPNTSGKQQLLRIRFDALGHVREVLKEEKGSVEGAAEK